MKKQYVYIISLLFFASSNLFTQQPFGGGDGSEEQPFQI